MYNPSPFKTLEKKQILDFLKEFNFGTIFAVADGEMWTASLPMLADDSISTISGHFAAANQIWKHIDGKEVMVVFQGPNHYISPSWYGEEYAVPTWNYLSAVARGKVRILQDDGDKMRIVDELSDFHEGRIGQGWKADWEEPRYTAQLKAIVAFEIHIDDIELKRKLSQNHPRDKTRNVSEHLLGMNDRDAAYIGNLMRGL